MFTRIRSRRLLTLWSIFICVASSHFPGGSASGEGARKKPEKLFDETKAVTLFAFDNHAIPFTQNLKLTMHSPQKHAANPVVKRGKPGRPDSWAVQFYGSVIRVKDKFRMWYVAVGEERLEGKVPRSSPWRVAYAESKDGINWTKPNLGLVEYRGSKNNNLVSMTPRLGVVNLKVLYEPNEKNPDLRYKLGTHVWFPKNKVRLGTFAPYASRDGLNWKLMIDAKPVNAELQPKDVVIPPLHFEPVGGLYKWDGLYYLSGQNAIVAARPYHGRVVRGFVSADFKKWSPASAVSFVRNAQHKLLGPGRSREGEQNHEAVSVWNRGNVLLGISGLWHGGKEWKDVTVDLGFVLSNDGVHFRQPLDEFVFLKRGKKGKWDSGGLLQGQGFENIGDKTLIYYGAWHPGNTPKAARRGGVGLATLPRDRFGDLRVDLRTQGKGNYQMPKTESSLLTKAVTLKSGSPHVIYINAAGLGKEARLKIELLDAKLKPLPKYSGKNAAIIDSNGFQTQVAYNGNTWLYNLPNRIRLRVTFEGKRKADIRLSAIYVK